MNPPFQPSEMPTQCDNRQVCSYVSENISFAQLGELNAEGRRAEGLIVFGVDFDSGEVLYLDGEIGEWSPFSLAQLVKDPGLILSTLHPFDQANLLSVRDELLQHRESEKIVDLERPDGDTQTLRVVLSLVEKWGRRFIVGSAATLWRLDESKLKADAFRLAVDRAHEGLAVTDRDGNYVYLNQEHLRLFGYSKPAELIGKSWRNLYDKTEAELIERTIFPELFARGFWTGTIRARRKNGETFNENLTLSILPGGGIVCNCRDRTQEIEVAEQLVRSEATMRDFLDAMSEIVLIRRIGGPYTFVNEAACRAFGVDASRLIGRHELPWLPKVVGERFLRADEELMSDSEQRKLEFDVPVEFGGATRIVAVKKFCIRPDARGKFTHVCTIMTDVTERRRHGAHERQASELRREHMRMRREFIAMASHEFRSPLTAMVGTNYLLSKKLDADQRPAGDDVARLLDLQSRALTTVKELVDQVMLLNRIEHMNADWHTVPTKLEQFLVGIVADFNATLGEPQVVFNSDLSLDFSPAFDVALMRAALENLISNGLKYSPARSPIDVRALESGEDWVLEVQDRGRGIPAEHRAKLFTPFLRASNVRGVPGTGLGLTIVKRVADFHGGKVACASEEGRGTTFTLTFPRSLPLGKI